MARRSKNRIALGALGMVLMTVFAFRLDSSDPKANWLEQAVNPSPRLAFSWDFC